MKVDGEMLLPDRKAVRAQLAKARRRLERRPNSWVWLEQVGRCLRCLEDPDAVTYFRQGAANYKVKEGHAGDQMRLGNLYRLAGDTAAARIHFEQARALYGVRVPRADPNPLDLEHMVAASFLVGRDGEVAELIARLRAIDRDTDLIAYPIARLAQARRTRDVKMAAVAVAEFAGMIQRYRAKVWNTGGVLPWDWYQIGLETLQVLSRDQAR